MRIVAFLLPLVASVGLHGAAQQRPQAPDREATAKGYVLIAPEYRGSIGYGKAFYDAIDYGGTEVDDVVTAVDVLKSAYPQVDPARIGIVGWSHGDIQDVNIEEDMQQVDALRSRKLDWNLDPFHGAQPASTK